MKGGSHTLSMGNSSRSSRRTCSKGRMKREGGREGGLKGGGIHGWWTAKGVRIGREAYMTLHRHGV